MTEIPEQPKIQKYGDILTKFLMKNYADEYRIIKIIITILWKAKVHMKFKK